MKYQGCLLAGMWQLRAFFRSKGMAAEEVSKCAMYPLVVVKQYEPLLFN